MTKRDVGFDGLIVGGVILILIGIVSKIYWIAGIASGYLLLLGLGYLAARNEQKLEDAKKRLAGKQQVKGGECHKNNDTEGTVDPKTLENGNVLRMLVEQFVNAPCKKYYVAVLRCLRDSFIVIPGDIEISDADMNAFLKAKKGDMVTTREQMKFVPDILRNGDEFFLPVFSSADQMGEYGNRFSKMERHFFDAMRYANGKENVCGIVLDAFTQPYVVRKGDFDFIGELPTMLKTESDEAQ